MTGLTLQSKLHAIENLEQQNFGSDVHKWLQANKTMEVLEREVEARLRAGVSFCEQQCNGGLLWRADE